MRDLTLRMLWCDMTNDLTILGGGMLVILFVCTKRMGVFHQIMYQAHPIPK